MYLIKRPQHAGVFLFINGIPKNRLCYHLFPVLDKNQKGCGSRWCKKRTLFFSQ
jgi:hypothetical protein